MRGRPIALLWTISVLALYNAGCANRAKPQGALCLAKPAYAKPTHGVDSSASVYLSSMVFHGPAGKRGFVIDLKSPAEPDGKPLAPFLPLLSNADLALRVRQPKSPTQTRAYGVLLGRDLDRDFYTAGQVETSAASVTVYAGWALMAGDYPLGKSQWVSGAADGTVFIVRVEPAADRGEERHYIYNLRAGNPSAVCVTLLATSETRPLQPGEYVVVTERTSKLPAAQQIQLGDLFIADVLRRAAQAGVDLSGIPRRK